MVPTKNDTPHVPVSSNEIIEQVHEAYELGITIAHLHAREENQKPAYQKSIYQPIFEGVRKHCPDLVICGSTSGRNFSEFEKRSEVIELKPDMCSLTLSSLNFPKQSSMNALEMIQKLAVKMNEFGVNPELECFDLGMINYGKYLISKEIISGPNYWNLIFGNIAGMQCKSTHFKTAISDIPEGDYAGFGGIGIYQQPTLEWAIDNNIGVRVGLEDNLWLDNQKTKLATNIDLVRKVHEKITLGGKQFLTAKELGNAGFYNKKRN